MATSEIVAPCPACMKQGVGDDEELPFRRHRGSPVQGHDGLQLPMHQLADHEHGLTQATQILVRFAIIGGHQEERHFDDVDELQLTEKGDRADLGMLTSVLDHPCPDALTCRWPE